MDTMMGTIGDRVRSARIAALMTQEHLAGAASVSVRTIARMERGDPMSAETIMAVGSALGCDFRVDTQISAPDGWGDDGVIGTAMPENPWMNRFIRLMGGSDHRASLDMVRSVSQKMDSAGEVLPSAEAAQVMRMGMDNCDDKILLMDAVKLTGDPVMAWGRIRQPVGRLASWLASRQVVNPLQVRDLERTAMKLEVGPLSPEWELSWNLAVFYSMFVLWTDFITWACGYGWLGRDISLGILVLWIFQKWQGWYRADVSRACKLLELCDRLGMPAATSLRIVGDGCRQSSIRNGFIMLSEACTLPAPKRAESLGKIGFINVTLTALKDGYLERTKNGDSPLGVSKAIREASEDKAREKGRQFHTKMKAKINTVSENIQTKLGGVADGKVEPGEHSL